MEGFCLVGATVDYSKGLKELFEESGCTPARGFALGRIEEAPESVQSAQPRIGFVSAGRQMPDGELRSYLKFTFGVRPATVRETLKLLALRWGMIGGICGSVAALGSSVASNGIETGPNHRFIAAFLRGTDTPWMLDAILHSNASIWVGGWYFAVAQDQPWP